MYVCVCASSTARFPRDALSRFELLEILVKFIGYRNQFWRAFGGTSLRIDRNTGRFCRLDTGTCSAESVQWFLLARDHGSHSSATRPSRVRRNFDGQIISDGAERRYMLAIGRRHIAESRWEQTEEKGGLPSLHVKAPDTFCYNLPTALSLAA
jgi:hypothetical protein